MKILIDMQGLQTPFSSRRGVGTYIDGVVRELSSIGANHQISYLFNAEFPESYFDCLSKYSDFLSTENTHVFSQRILPDYHSGDPQRIAVAEAFVSSFIESIEPDVLFSPNLQEGLHDPAVTSFAAGSGRFIQVATLHDMVPMHLPDDYLSDPRTRRWYMRKITDAKRCDKIVTVSESSKSEIIRFVGLDGSKVEVIPNGFDAKRYNPKFEAGERKLIESTLGLKNGQYILYVGTADKHKNIIRLIEAYALLPSELREKFPLVLGGGGLVSAVDVLKAVGRNSVQKDVMLPGFIPNDILPSLIRQASLFVFPSTHEGFGLPALEAMACGTPTIGSRASAVGEVLGDRRASFDPLDTREIAALMTEVLSNPNLRATLRKRGLRRASDFSWRGAAERLLAVMADEHERRSGASSLSFISRRLSNALGDCPTDVVQSAAITIAETAPISRQPRLFLDVSSVAQFGGNSGIQRVTRNIAAHISATQKKYGSDAEIVYAPEGSSDFRILRSFATDGSFAPDPESDQVVGFAASDRLLFLDLHPGLAIRMTGQAQRMRALGVKVYHVVYDILPVLKPEKFWPELVEEFYQWLQSISRSDGVACISRTVAEDVAEYLARFGVKRPDRLPIGHFRLGSDFASRSKSNRAELTQLLGKELKFLVVGTLEPRKAHEQTILAFEQAWSTGKQWRLILAGKLGWNMDRLGKYIREHPQFGRRLFWFQNPTDVLLAGLYDLADCIICPSEGEGFGLPLVEAANVGKPVIARELPVFREVAGKSAFYFPDERSPNTIRTAIENWAEEHSKNRHPKPPATRAFTWLESARELAKLINDETWDTTVQPTGALDLRQTITLSNLNIRLGGFFDREGDFFWAAANASIEFETDRDFENIFIEMECFSWKQMPYSVLVDGKQVFESTASETAVVITSLLDRLPLGKHRIVVRSGAAGTPENDTRVLGIALKQFRMGARLPVMPGEWISVRDKNVTWEGFSAVEFGWRWSVGRRSAIEFLVAEGCSSAAISLFGQASGAWNATFVLNGKRIYEEQLNTQLMTLRLPAAEILAGANVLEIIFESVPPFSQDDPRPLGLQILEFGVDVLASANPTVLHPALERSSAAVAGH